jgi:hypothetical protein
MQSVRYAFRSVASTLVETLFNLRAPVEQSVWQLQTQTRADLIKSLLNQQDFNFLHRTEMVCSLALLVYDTGLLIYVAPFWIHELSLF